jgi:hypothetical protein
MLSFNGSPTITVPPGATIASDPVDLEVQPLTTLAGVSDIGHPAANDLPEQAVSAEQVIGGLKQLITRAHARQIKIFGATNRRVREIFYTARTPKQNAKRSMSGSGRQGIRCSH